MRVRSYERLESGNESARAALELLHAEVLDTVSLERTVQFITLDVTDIATTRAELQKLYLSNFSGIDPGIVAANAGRADGNRLLPILDRFVEPDVEVPDTDGPMEGWSPPAEPPVAVLWSRER